MPDFLCEFYLASETNLKNALSCSFSDWEIGQFGALYGENLLLSLARHYQLYTNPVSSGFDIIHNTYTGNSVGRFDLLSLKKKAPLVSGNIGEAIAMPALTACCNVPINAMPFQRFHASVKCPDYRFATEPTLLSTLWNIPLSKFSNFPEDLPMEVKSHLGNDQKYPIGALQQLKSYWKECVISYPQGVGFGVISRVNLKSRTIRYFLFIPKNGVHNLAISRARINTHYTNPSRYFEV